MKPFLLIFLVTVSSDTVLVVLANILFSTFLCFLKPLLTLESFLVTKFSETGDVRVTVQASCGSSMLQDSKVVHVFGETLLLLILFVCLFHVYLFLILLKPALTQLNLL